MTTTSQDSTAAPGKTDNYALDDTLAGRIVQSVAVAIVTSLPDWFERRSVLIAAYIGSLLGFGALVAVVNAYDEEDGEEPETPEQSEAELADGDVSEPRQIPRWVPLFVALLIILDIRLNIAIARRLRKAGITKPWSLLGAIAGVLAFLASESEARKIERQAS